MRRFETTLGLLFGFAFALLAFLAIFVLGTLIYQGPAASKAPAYAIDTSTPEPETPTKTAADTAADTAGDAAGTTAGETPAGAIDLAAGEAAFTACKACHKADKAAKHSTGPALWGVFGRAIGTADGFAYSADLAALSGQVWDETTLDRFLTKPKDMVKGTKMTFAGVKDANTRANLIGWLAQQSDTPTTLAGTAATEATPTDAAVTEAQPAAPSDPYADLPDDAVVELAPVAYPEGVTYANPPAPSAEELAAIGERLAALSAEIPTLDYQRARYHPIHFPPAIEQASNEECLACHQETLSNSVRETSPAGVKAADSLAWYQTLDTYSGPQATFHWRHLESDFAKQTMNLQCNFCHKGNDPREETPDMLPTRPALTASATPEFTLRKMVNPSETCLLCHGSMPDPENIMGLGGKWHEVRGDMEYAEAPNGCLSCHAETFRTNRHQVNYLNAANIEELARSGTSDTCYGCHGGRAWYRTSYPYPRHDWPGMDKTTVPEWAANRPTASKPEHQLAKP